MTDRANRLAAYLMSVGWSLMEPDEDGAVVVCPACSASCDTGDNFCYACGARLPAPQNTIDTLEEGIKRALEEKG